MTQATLTSVGGTEATAASRSARAMVAIGVKRLVLADFRGYGSLRLGGGARPDLDSRPIVLVGPNGAGKTNLLEALSFLAPGRGLRRARLSDIDRRSEGGSRPWTVSASLETGSGIVDVGTGRDSGHGGDGGGERRLVRIDGRDSRGQKELTRLASIAWITPEMDRLFVDGPSTRRRFLDRLVHGHDPEHAARVSAYEHALRERARLLERGANADSAWLTALEEVMAREGVAIAASRMDIAGRIDRAAAEEGPFPAAALTVVGEVESWLAEDPALAVEDRLRDTLAASRRQDGVSGGAAHGPHRSDLAVKHRRRNEAAARCSTGEQKALLLSVVLAAARLVAAERGVPPILLLDEVAAHLDASRRAALFDLLVEMGGQAWLTGTDEDLFAGLWGRALFLKVESASVSQA